MRYRPPAILMDSKAGLRSLRWSLRICNVSLSQVIVMGVSTETPEEPLAGLEEIILMTGGHSAWTISAHPVIGPKIPKIPKTQRLHTTRIVVEKSLPMPLL